MRVLYGGYVLEGVERGQYLLNMRCNSYDPETERTIPVAGFVFQNFEDVVRAIDSMNRYKQKA